MANPLEIRVSLDVGSKRHFVALGLSTGELLKEFAIDHKLEGFNYFFEEIRKQVNKYKVDVCIAMEGFNGWSSPLDKLILEHGYRLFNMNSLKLKRFKDVFPSPAKKDSIDARKGLELFQLQDHLPLAKGVLQEVGKPSEVNERLKLLTRRRRRLVNEKVSYINNLQSDLQSLMPGILDITSSADNVWFLSFLSCAGSLEKLPTLTRKELLKVRGVGHRYAEKIQEWQQKCLLSPNVPWEQSMLLMDVERIIYLRDHIKGLEKEIEQLTMES